MTETQNSTAAESGRQIRDPNQPSKVSSPTVRIDEAIEVCEQQIKGHRRSAAAALLYLFVSSVGIIAFSTFFATLGRYRHIDAVENFKKLLLRDSSGPGVLAGSVDQFFRDGNVVRIEPASTLSNFFAITVLLAAIAAAGIFVSIHKFHLKEISRCERLIAGLLRIRIVSSSPEESALGDVISALVAGAFEREAVGQSASNVSRVENPLPGHPTSDAATALINKVLERVEISFPGSGSGEST